VISQQSAARGRRLAALAVSGLLAGLPACAGPARNEAIVDPAAPSNTGSASEVAALELTAAEPEITEDPAPEPRPKKKKKKKLRDAAQRGLVACCAGKNDCKGLGGCQTDRNDCRGKNMCKGLGGCSAGLCEGDTGAPSPSPSGTKMCCAGKNECKGKGNCKTNDNACKGQNDCKGKGGCKGPC
jgi:hypothetical protein